MNRLLSLREEKGISQEQVAQLLNVTRQAYSRYERGERELGYSALQKLSQFFDVSVDYLLGFSELFYPDRLNTVASTIAPISSDYTETERQLIKEFRKLPADSRKLVLRMVGIDSASQEGKKKAWFNIDFRQLL